MSIIVGKSARFTTSNKAQANADHPFKNRLRPGQLKNPMPPRAYQLVNVGPELTLEFENNQALPVDGSNSLLRNLSPFYIQIEPPLAFANEPQSSAKAKAVGIFDAAYQGQSTTLGGERGGRNSFLFSGNLKSSPDEILARQDPSPQSNASGDGAQLVDSRGRGGAGKLGNPSIADLKTALDIVSQLTAIKDSPPLVMLINPNNLSVEYSRIQQFSDRSRTGYIYQAWGEEQPRLSISAKCGAFLSGGRGVQYASKRDSASWQNLMTLFHFYRSNGYLYDTLGKSNAHLFVGGLSIHYDGKIYYGHMESFSWNYDENTQLGGVEFQMEFVCSVMVDTSKQTQTVLPMSMQGASSFFRGNDVLVDQGAHLIDQWLGGPDNPSQNAPPEFTGSGGVSGRAEIPSGGGFAPPPAVAENGSAATSTRAVPFRRG